MEPFVPCGQWIHSLFSHVSVVDFVMCSRKQENNLSRPFLWIDNITMVKYVDFLARMTARTSLWLASCCLLSVPCCGIQNTTFVQKPSILSTCCFNNYKYAWFLWGRRCSVGGSSEMAPNGHHARVQSSWTGCSERSSSLFVFCSEYGQ